MAGPWEKYAQAQTSPAGGPSTGPWAKYQAPAPGGVPPAGPSAGAFDLAPNSSTTVRGVAPAVPVPISNDDSLRRFTEGLTTNKPPEGLAGKVGRDVLPVLGGIAGGAAGAGIASVGTAALGGAAAESGRQALVNALATYNGDTPATPGEVLGNVAASGAAQGAGQAGGLALAKAAPYVKDAVVGTVKALMKGIGGISDAAAQRVFERPVEVLKRMNADPEAAPRWAEVFKKSIQQHIDKASETYHKLIDGVVRSDVKYGPGFKLDLQDGIGTDLAKISDEFGFGRPGRMVDAADSEKYMAVLRRANELKNASPEDVYFFQRDLNAASRDAQGSSLGVALGKVAKATRKYLARSIPEIGAANKTYAEAMAVSEEAANLLSADNLVSKTAGAFANKTATRSKLLDLATRVPRAARALEGMLDAKAGAEFAPLMRNVPQTGFLPGAAIGAGAALASGSPAAIAGTAALSPFLSPRLSGLGVLGAHKAGLALSPVGPYLKSAISPSMQAVLQAADLFGRDDRRRR